MEIFFLQGFDLNNILISVKQDKHVALIRYNTKVAICSIIAKKMNEDWPMYSQVVS